MEVCNCKRVTGIIQFAAFLSQLFHQINPLTIGAIVPICFGGKYEEGEIGGGGNVEKST